MSPPHVWWKGADLVKRMGATATAVTAVLVLVTLVTNLLQIGEPHWVATRSFVREFVLTVETKADADRAKQTQRSIKTEIQVLKGQRAQMVSEIKRRELLLEDPTAQGSPEYRRLIRDQIDQYRDQIKEMDVELEGLIREQSGRRP